MKQWFMLIACLGWFTSLLTTPIVAQTKYEPNPVVGNVNGQDLQLSDILNKPLYDAASKYHALLEAAFMKTAVEQAAQKHPEISLKPILNVTEAQMKNVYKEHGLSKRGSFDKLKPQIKAYLEQQLTSSHYLKQYEIAKRKGWIKNFLETPPEFTASINVGDSFIRGNENAKVMVLEFSDYQCPFCSRIQGTISALIQSYGKKVAFAYKHFPLSFHTEADEAAIAVECAREQNKFPEMHEVLYNNQRSQHKDQLKGYARQIKVNDPKKFDSCLDQEYHRAKVDLNIKEGAEVGITGTPGFMIGVYDPKSKTLSGETLSGALPKERFEAVIKKYLNKKS